jgi:hypothetical protein
MAPTKKVPQQQQSLLSFFSSQGSLKNKSAKDNKEVITEKLAVEKKAKENSAKQKSAVSNKAPTSSITASQVVAPASSDKEVDDSKMDTDSDDDTPLVGKTLVNTHAMRIQRNTDHWYELEPRSETRQL